MVFYASLDFLLLWLYSIGKLSYLLFIILQKKEGIMRVEQQALFTEFRCARPSGKKESLRCNYCGKISSLLEVVRHARENGVCNTTCPFCGQPAAFSKAWLCPDGRVKSADSLESRDFNLETEAILITHPGGLPHH